MNKPCRNGFIWLKRSIDLEKYDVVVIGAGPAGIFTALEIYKHASPDYKI